MARLVSYYNLGHMTTETGTVINNPAGTSNRIDYWEPWNEPDLSNETPCVPDTGVALTPDEFLTMWNAVVPAMLAVDPTLKFVGPATAGGPVRLEARSGNEYVDTLMQGGDRAAVRDLVPRLRLLGQHRHRQVDLRRRRTRARGGIAGHRRTPASTSTSTIRRSRCGSPRSTSTRTGARTRTTARGTSSPPPGGPPRTRSWRPSTWPCSTTTTSWRARSSASSTTTPATPSCRTGSSSR